MSSAQRTVLVLGAGFTKAFYPEAPLLTGDYYEDLIAQLQYFPRARRILELERNHHAAGWINIERLMTRLDGRMPYDVKHGAHGEFGLASSEIKRWFAHQLQKAKDGQHYAEELEMFADYSVENSINCMAHV